ncbi:MAG TPA: VOC family protein [Acidimicrobiia bacterium]|nr:VOC family protein [Acidimicrobiia bacterium]
MFGDTKVLPSFSVDDVAAAQEFYGETLGMKVSEESGALWLHPMNGYDVLVYPKPDHIPASHTILNFVVEDIDEAVDGLVARGVRFLRFDGYGPDDKGIVRTPDRQIAWFSDPAGNVLSVAHLETS